MYTEAIKFTEQNEVLIVDQTLLPGQLKYISINNLEDSIEAIKKLKIRGAPAIGIMAAYSLFIVANNYKSLPKEEFLKKLSTAAEKLNNARPTAVNLSGAINRLNQLIYKISKKDINSIIDLIKAEAIKIHQEDRESCHQMGIHGLEIVPQTANIITHCNAGSLATGGWGTALGVIYAAAENKRNLHVFVDETRPLGQGARLTYWELSNAGIPCTLITDSMAASLMGAGKINLVLFGADRIASNGDVANKIGSYSLAISAHYHNIPCYSVAPVSTFDFNIKSGQEIPIEQRDAHEITKFYNYNGTEDKINVFNPAFDVTPAHLFSGLITEKGVIKQPLKTNISRLIN